MLGASIRRGFIFFMLLLLLHKECSVTAENQIEKEIAIHNRLPRSTIPESYDIKLVPEIVGSDSIHHGDAKISLKVVEKTANVTLHSENLRILKNFTSLVDTYGVIYKPKNHTHVEDKSFLIIEFDQAIDIGNYTLNVKFTSDKANISFLKTSHEEHGQTIWTMFTRSTNRRSLFPCWDEPDLRANFNLSLKHFSNMTAVSNMPIRHYYQDNDGKQWTNFHTSPPISTHLMGLYISKFDCIQVNNERIRFCGAKNVLSTLKFAHHVSRRALVYLEKNMGFNSQNFPKMDIFSVPINEVVSAWGFKLLAIDEITYEAFKVPASKKVDAALIVIQSLISQYLDNLIPSWTESEQYTGIVSGLSIYLQYYIADKLYPDWRLFHTSTIFRIDGQRPKKSETLYYDNLIPLLNKSMYIHMLCTIVTEDVCIAGIAKFVNENQNRISNIDDLLESVQSVYDIQEKPSTSYIPIKEVMESWLMKSFDYPFVNVTRDYKTGRVMITQSPVRNSRKFEKTWWVPINLATKSNHNTLTSAVTHWLKPGNESLIIDGIDKNDWIIVNYQLTGFYYCYYDYTNLMRLGQYMKNENYSTIFVLNRASLMHDVFEIFKKGSYSIMPELFSITEYLSREDDCIPWFEVMQLVTLLRKDIFDYKVYAEISNYFVGLMDKLIEKFGFEDHRLLDWEKKYKHFYNSLDNRTKEMMPIEEALQKYYKGYQDEEFITKTNREEVLLLACQLGHKKCLESAKSQLGDYMKNATEKPISPDIVNWIKCSSAEGNEDYLLNTTVGYKSWDMTSTLKCIGWSPNKTVLMKYVDEVFCDKIRANNWELEYALLGLIQDTYVLRNHTYIRSMVNYVMKNYDRIYNYHRRTTGPEETETMLIILTQECMTQHTFSADEIKEIEDILKNAKFVDHSMIKNLAGIQLNRIQYSYKLSSGISKWIHNNASPSRSVKNLLQK